MCGIYGVWGEWRAPEAGLASIRRRGPDQRSSWNDCDAGIWLGHARLSIIDLSPSGAQPMLSPDGRYVMIYNGELYNFRELRAELAAGGESFQGSSDSEVLLRLFQQEGAACLERLNGIFAVAFWDRRDRILTLARDPLGVKPLYYTRRGDSGFAFASEMKALIRSGDVTPQIAPQAVLHHLGLLWSPGRGTIVREIEKLLPGEALELGEGGRERRWTFSDPGLPTLEQRADRTEADVIAGVAEAVETAVARQLVADVPLGAFLSGGLDSSAIAAFASRHRTSPGKLQCFSIEVDPGSHEREGFADDLPYARRVAAHLDVDLHVVKADSSMFDRLAEMVYFLDEPTGDPAAMNTLLIAELARAQGMTVLLSGAGGDDIFTGYRRHFALMQERWWAWLPAGGRDILAAATGMLPSRPAFARRLGKAFRNAGASADIRLASYFAWGDPSELFSLLSADLRQGLTPEVLTAPLIDTLRRIPDGASPLERMLYLERRHFLADHNLNYADKMGMAAGVEVRVPLLDLDLLQVAMAIPEGMKQRGTTGKWAFKKAMEPYLPHDVIYRPKTGFGVPLRQWLSGPLDGLVRDALAPSKMRSRGIFDAEKAQSLIDANRAGRIDASYTVFAILLIELWCLQYLDASYAVDPDLKPASNLISEPS